jgi:hypothetical protein
LKNFLEKYSEDTPINQLNQEEKKSVTSNFLDFLTSALYFMKKYYHYDDNIYSDLETLDPEKFSKQKWLDLKKHRSYVLKNRKIYFQYITHFKITFKILIRPFQK